MNKPISADFPFESQFVEVKGNRMHYVEAGEGDPILFIHGNPTSSYLWRNIIPYLKDQGRCIALDLIGMGKSDKPELDYSFNDHFEYLESFIEQLGLQNITLVIHDWGSGLGFHYAFKHQQNIKAIAFMEAVYKPVDWEKQHRRVKVGLTLMRSRLGNWLMIGVANLFVKKVIPNGVKRTLSQKELATYAEPYPDLKSRKPVRRWPQEIAIKGKPLYMQRIVSDYFAWLQETDIPKLCFYADPGMLIPKSEISWLETNFANLTTVDIGPGLHFIQEDNPHQIGEELAKWYRQLP